MRALVHAVSVYVRAECHEDFRYFEYYIFVFELVSFFVQTRETVFEGRLADRIHKVDIAAVFS